MLKQGGNGVGDWCPVGGIAHRKGSTPLVWDKKGRFNSDPTP